MKRKSTLDRIEFDNETYEILSHTSTDLERAECMADSRLAPCPMLGLQVSIAEPLRTACPPLGFVEPDGRHHLSTEDLDASAENSWLH